MNNLILSGRIGQEPDVKQIGAGQVVTFSLAETIFHKGEKGTAWHDCEAWGKAGEMLAKYAQKGSGITIQGSLKYDEWEKDGQKRKRAKVSIFAVEITSNWKQAEVQQSNVGRSYAAQAADQLAEDQGSDDLPF